MQDKEALLQTIRTSDDSELKTAIKSVYNYYKQDGGNALIKNWRKTQLIDAVLAYYRNLFDLSRVCLELTLEIEKDINDSEWNKNQLSKRASAVADYVLENEIDNL